MSPNKTLYVRDDDETIWEEAEAVSRATRLSLSQVVTTALRQLMASPPDIHVLWNDPEHPGGAPGTPLLQFPHPDRRFAGRWQVLSEDGDDYDINSGPLEPPIEHARAWLARNAADRKTLDQEEAMAALADAMADITVEVGDRNDNRWDEVFTGRWLIEPSDENRFGQDAGAAYGIALTKRGKIAVYCFHVNERFPPSLDVVDSLDDLDLAEEALAMAAAAMGEKRVVRRDI
jgi:hypothetical protein